MGTVTDFVAYRADRLAQREAEERLLAAAEAADRALAEDIAEMRALRLQMTGAPS